MQQLCPERKYYSEIVIGAKDNFFNRPIINLDDHSTLVKLYWSNINNFLNNKKIPT